MNNMQRRTIYPFGKKHKMLQTNNMSIMLGKQIYEQQMDMSSNSIARPLRAPVSRARFARPHNLSV